MSSEPVLASDQAAEPQEGGGQEGGGQAGAPDRDVSRAEMMWIHCPYCGMVFKVNNFSY